MTPVWIASFLFAVASTGTAHPDQLERIRALEPQLEAIRNAADPGQDLGATIDAIEQSLTDLQDDQRYLAGDDRAERPNVAGKLRWTSMAGSDFHVGYSHCWNQNLNSTFSAFFVSLDNSPFQPDPAIHKARSIHANVIWFPYPAVSTGVEVMWGERANRNGESGDAVRIQYMFKYKFN